MRVATRASKDKISYRSFWYITISSYTLDDSKINMIPEHTNGGQSSMHVEEAGATPNCFEAQPQSLRLPLL